MNRRKFMKMISVAAIGAVLPLPAVAAGAPVRPRNLIAEYMGVTAMPVESLPDWMFPLAIQKWTNYTAVYDPGGQP